jgi:hypothetical protein
MQGGFAHRAQAWRRERLRLCIDGRACLGRLRKWLPAGMVATEGRGIPPDTGVPPGGVVSPVVAHGSWH